MASIALSMVTMYMISNYMFGFVVGTLPFQPWAMASGMSHRGIGGEDMSEFSILFIAILCQMAFRGVIPKAMGFETPRMPVEHQTPKWLQDMQDNARQ